MLAMNFRNLTRSFRPRHRDSRSMPLRISPTLEGTSKNCHRSSAAPNLLANDSGLFPFRFCAVHPKDAGDCKPQEFFEVP
jgi:hypothetical protein